MYTELFWWFRVDFITGVCLESWKFGVVVRKEKLKYEPTNRFFPFFLQVKPQLESRENEIYNIFTAIIYRTQVVAGINYFIKVCPYDKRDYFVVKQCRWLASISCHHANIEIPLMWLMELGVSPYVYKVLLSPPYNRNIKACTASSDVNDNFLQDHLRDYGLPHQLKLSLPARTLLLFFSRQYRGFPIAFPFPSSDYFN